MMTLTAPIDSNAQTVDWRLYQLLKLGFTGDLADFLAASRIDLGSIRGWIDKGASPLDAARLEAGSDFAGDDRTFDHQKFDKLLKTPDKRTAPRKRVAKKKAANPPEG